MTPITLRSTRLGFYSIRLSMPGLRFGEHIGVVIPQDIAVPQSDGTVATAQGFLACLDGRYGDRRAEGLDPLVAAKKAYSAAPVLRVVR
jgi:hypothetical protein